MMRKNKTLFDYYFLSTLNIVFIFNIIIPCILYAQNSDPDPTRFDAEIKAFMEWDKKNSYNEDAILFVGSSSIRFWFTALYFKDLHVINRGFGGSHISDVNYYYDKIVKKYKPSKIVLYAGDNDIAYGKSPNKVVEDYKIFINKVQQDIPECSIYYISIKPSISRWQFWLRMLEANSEIKEVAHEKPNLFYIDISTPMLDETGDPSSDLFREDNLHLNDKGYQLWSNIVLPYIK